MKILVLAAAALALSVVSAQAQMGGGRRHANAYHAIIVVLLWM